MSEEQFSVYIQNDFGCFSDIIPVAVGVDKASANSICRHYNTLFDRQGVGTKWDGTGLYCSFVSRKWCINHEDFESLSVECPSAIPANIRLAYCKEVMA